MRETVRRIEPYVPGKPVEEVQRELGLTDVIKMASNENPLGPSPRAVEAIRRFAAEVHVYPDGAVTALREAVAARLGVDPSWILFGNGSDEVVKLVAEAYLEPGTSAVMPTPSFVTYRYAALLMGAEPVEVPLREGRLDLPAMARAVGETTRVVFVCNPNNPTGTAVRHDELVAFLRRLPEDVLVVVDEAYREYVEDPAYPDTLRLLAGRPPVMVLRTFSKIYGLAGLRVGYGVAAPEVIAEVAQVKEPFSVNLLAQKAALAALEDREHLERSREVNRSGKAQLYAGFERLGLPYLPTEANFVLVDLQREARPVYEGLLRRGVIVRPLGAMGLRRQVRVTVGTEPMNARFLAALEEVLAEAPAPA